MKSLKLSYRFALITLFTFALILLGFLLSASQISQKMADAHAQRAAVSMLSAEAAISSISAKHALFVRDYSFWDDMAEAVQRKDTQWLAQEFYGPLEIYQADAAWVIDRHGGMLYQSENQDQIPFPLPVRELAEVVPPKDMTDFYQLHGQLLVNYQIGPILYHSQEEKNTHPYGYIIVATVWRQTHLDEINKLLQAKSSIVPGFVTPPQSSSSSRQLGIPFYDARGAAAATLQVTFNDQSLQLMNALFKQQGLQTAGLGLLGIIGCTLILQIMIIDPTKRLIRKLENLTSQTKRASSQTKQSELDILSDLIDRFLAQSEKIKEKNAELKSADAEINDTMDQLKRSERQLRNQLQESSKLAKAVESATDAIVITDEKALIQYVNPAWTNLNGYSMEEARGKQPSILKSNRTNSMVYKHLWEHLRQGEPYSSDDVINRRKDGTLYAAHISVFPVREHNRTTNFVGIVQDISVSKERERLKSEFISLASHQLRTPLTSLRWLSELLRKNAAKFTQEKTHDILTDIEASSLRMISLVNRLLNLSRIETGRLSITPSRFSLQDLIASIRSEMSPHLKKKSLRLLVKIQDQSRTITCDRELLHEALTNLLSNAFKYTPSKGVIALRVEREKEYLRFSVVDSGIGIPVNEQHRMFERFFRASNAIEVDNQGSGLGLYLVKLIVEVQGGEIEIESTEGKGTTVSFTLPIRGVHQTGEVSLTPSKII